MKQRILSDQEQAHLAQVIGEVERRTRGELRVMIVSRSTPEGQPFVVSWYVLSLVLMTWAWLEPRFLDSPIQTYIPLLAVFWAAVVALVLSRLKWWQRLWLSSEVASVSVWARAELEFYRQGLNATEGATGILIFVSLFERKAVVLADNAISSRLPQETWSQVVATVIQGARAGTWAQHLEQAIRHCGEILATHFPALANDRNELPDALILKD